MHVLCGKVAVVTGASKGIGAGIARALAEAGAAVVVNYASDQDGAGRVVADIQAKGGKALAVQANVSHADDVTRLFDDADRAFGRLDILINNAGVYAFAPLEDVTEEEFHRQFGTNVLGLLLVSREASKRFGPDGGSIVNIGSTATSMLLPGTSVYTATKGAVDAVTGVLAKELAARNIRVNSINPGGTETEGVHAMGLIGSEMEAQMVAQTPLGRMGQPEDIAPIAVFLASGASRWLTGEKLSASGGLR